MNLNSTETRVPYKGKWITKREYDSIVDKNKLKRKDTVSHSKPNRAKVIMQRNCLDCGQRFVAESKYNRMCDVCKRMYRNVSWVG